MPLKALWLPLVLALAACDPPTPPTTFKDINAQIFQRSCANFSTCHSVQGARDAGNLDMKTDPYKAIVNVVSSLRDPKANGTILVKPFEPDNSLLYLKLLLPLSNTDDGGYEESMPLGNPHLPDYDISGIRMWIIKGAPND